MAGIQPLLSGEGYRRALVAGVAEDQLVPCEHEGVHGDDGGHGGGAAPESDGGERAWVTGEWIVAPGAGARRGEWTYLANAAMHPANLLLLVSVMFLALIFWSGPVLLAGLGTETALVVVVARRRFFRRAVDACLDVAEHAAAQRARHALIVQMGKAQRGALAKIEALLGKTVADAEHRHGAALRGRAGNGQRTNPITDGYIRLSIAYRVREELLATTDRQAIEDTICSLEATDASAPVRVSGLRARRLRIARRRAECWSRTREDLQLIGQQLALIAELALLLHEESFARSSPAPLSKEVDRALSDFEDAQDALCELSELDPVESPDGPAA
jgi:hypothetical protein